MRRRKTKRQKGEMRRKPKSRRRGRKKLFSNQLL